MRDDPPHEKDHFAGYRWCYFSSLRDGPLKSRAERFLESINWTSLIQCASAKRDGLHCQLLPDVGLGYNHLVRVIEFADDTRWVARLRMPPLTRNDSEAANACKIMKSEYETIRLIQRESQIPVPCVHLFAANPSCSIGAQFMLMDCLEGNVGMDLSMKIPPEHKVDVYPSMAGIQIDLFNIRLPKIGKVVGINKDGTYRQGPLPNLGGPFDTAADFLRAWSSTVKFGLSESRLQDAAGPYADEISQSLSAFRGWVNDNAEHLSANNTGPFPLCHGDFGHNNIVFDDNYRLLGVIDWETAFAAPYEISGEFALSLSVIPPAMDVSWKYDEAGCPKDPEVGQKFDDRTSYIAIVRHKEQERGLTGGYTLSAALQDAQRQHLASAMRLYQDGIPGWYFKVAEEFTGHG